MGTTTTNNLGETIREHRIKLRLKVYELAKKIDIHPAYLTQIEKNVRTPSPEVLRKIEDVLSLELKDAYIRLKFPTDFLSKRKTAQATDIYDMVITVGNDAAIGIDIKVKKSKTLNHKLVAQKIEEALLKSFPAATIKSESSIQR